MDAMTRHFTDRNDYVLKRLMDLKRELEELRTAMAEHTRRLEEVADRLEGK